MSKNPVLTPLKGAPISLKYSELFYFVNLINALDYSDRIAKAYDLANAAVSGNSKVKALAEKFLSAEEKDETKARKIAAGWIRKIERDYMPEYQEEVERLRVNNCAVDPTTKIISKDKDGKYEFTKDGSLAFARELKELSEKKVAIELRAAEKIHFSALPEDVVEYLENLGVII